MEDFLVATLFPITLPTPCPGSIWGAGGWPWEVSGHCLPIVGTHPKYSTAPRCGSLMQCPRVSRHSCRTPQANPTQPSNPSIAKQGSDGVIAWGHNTVAVRPTTKNPRWTRQSKQDPSSPRVGIPHYTTKVNTKGTVRKSFQYYF